MSILPLFAVISALAISSIGQAEVIVDINFNGNTNNAGIGPNGVLMGGATLVSNQLRTNGSNAAEPVGAGLDLPLGDLAKIFNGRNDFLIEFDFRSAAGDTGALFSADGSHALADPGDPDEEDMGALNIYLGTGPDSGVTGIIADLWYMGEVAVAEDPANGIFFNDGAVHHVKLEYSAVTKILMLTVDDLEPEFDDFEFNRNTSNDIVRLGDENNADFGGDINDGFNGLFDNLRIEGTLVPEPSALLLMAFGSILCLLRGARR